MIEFLSELLFLDSKLFILYMREHVQEQDYKAMYEINIAQIPDSPLIAARAQITLFLSMAVASVSRNFCKRCQL
jgi:hypothetical protein